MDLSEGEKGGIVLESDLPKIWDFHAIAQTAAVVVNSTFLDYCRGVRVLCRDDSFAQFSGDRDQVKDGSSANHYDTRNGHGVQLSFAQSCPGTIIALKSRDGHSDDLWIGVRNTDDRLGHQKDARRALCKANACLR